MYSTNFPITAFSLLSASYLLKRKQRDTIPSKTTLPKGPNRHNNREKIQSGDLTHRGTLGMVSHAGGLVHALLIPDRTVPLQ